MPLLPGKANIGANIHELTVNGSRPRSHAQIVAIALSEADRTRRADGGPVDFSYSPPNEEPLPSRRPLFGEDRRPPNTERERPMIEVTGDIGRAYGPVPSVTATYRHSVPFAIGGGIGRMPHMMSPSEGSPWWTRSAAHEITSPMHGGIGHMATGGLMSASEASPWTERADARIVDQPFHSGLIGGSGAGRTDQIPLAVGTGSHVIPADAVSGAGQHATAFGANALQAAMRTGPWGVPLPHEVHGHGPPAPPHVSAAANDPGPAGIEKSMMTGLAEGGQGHQQTSILAASGEVVVPREDVIAIGKRGLRDGRGKPGESAEDVGHRLLDEMIAKIRRFNIAWLKTAPSPKK